MLNYYYEIKDDVQVFGQDIKYLSITDLKPDTIGWRHIHDEAVQHSRRVWLENANGVYQVKPAHALHRPYTDLREFALIKLKSRTIEWWSHD